MKSRFFSDKVEKASNYILYFLLILCVYYYVLNVDIYDSVYIESDEQEQIYYYIFAWLTFVVVEDEIKGLI